MSTSAESGAILVQAMIFSMEYSNRSRSQIESLFCKRTFQLEAVQEDALLQRVK
jgi:hypothetical protein